MKAMLNKLVKRNGGFTLTELAVAMVVVGILASIAVPSFLGARNNAFDREAQAAVDAALNAASLHYANNGDFTNSVDADCHNDGSTQLAADLERLDPNYDFLKADVRSDGPRRVSVTTSLTFNTANEALGCQAFHAAVLSRSGTCWVGRLTVEGKFFGAITGVVSDTPIVVNTGTFNTSNSVTTGFVDLAVNGKAYGAIIPVASGAGASAATPSDSFADSVEDCTALAQKVASADTVNGTPGVNANEYYESWRTVVFSANG